jgi:hypothetical protein
MSKILPALLAIASLVPALPAAAARAEPILPDPLSLVVPVADGCGPYAWRGPWGHCRDTPYYGPLPGGNFQPRPDGWNGCPPGYWHGPWGHCRDTPYHGRLPDGSWK